MKTGNLQGILPKSKLRSVLDFAKNLKSKYDENYRNDITIKTVANAKSLFEVS